MEGIMDKNIKKWLNAKLFEALSKANETDVENLIELGADIKSLDLNSVVEFHGKEISLLSVACEYGKLNLVKLLVENGADVNKLEKNLSSEGLYCKSPIVHALSNLDGICRHEIVVYLTEHGAKLDWFAESDGNIQLDPKKMLSLVNIASYFGNYETVDYLIKKGAPLYFGDPLTYAKERLEYQKKTFNTIISSSELSKYEKTVETIASALSKTNEGKDNK